MSDITPDKIHNPQDKGDETLLRYRYQITYSAIISLGLLDETKQIDEIFCEQFEDILIKLVNGKFIGVQVKTRELKFGSFETTDEPIMKSIERFLKLEKKFPEKFERFTIVSNAGFYGVDSSYKNLNWIIQMAKEGKKSELLKNRSKTKSIIMKLSKDNSCSEDEVISLFAKIVTKGDAAGLHNVFQDLQYRLSSYNGLNSQTTSTLNAVAERLIQYHFKASSLQCEVNLTEDYLTGLEFKEEKDKRIIESKKIKIEIIKQIIDDCLQNPISLLSTNLTPLDDLPKGNERLVTKMDKGGISFENVALQKDNKYAAEKHFASWIHKHGTNRATQQFNQVKLVVQNECQSSFDENLSDNQAFGSKMLIDVRKRLKERIDKDKETFFDCKTEHLLGMSGILTEDCSVWWSPKFDIDK